MKHFLKRMPLEFYVLVLPSIFLAIAFGGAGLLKSGLASFPVNKDVLSLENLFFYPLILFVFVRFVVFMFTTARDPETLNSSNNISLKTIYSIFFIILCLVLTTYSVALTTSWVFQNADSVRSIEISKKIMSFDFLVFKTYPPFVLQKLGHYSHLLEVFIVNSYLHLFLLIKLFLFVTFFKKDVFRKFVFAFFIGFLVTFPLWYMFPVMYPSGMYRVNVFNVEVPKDIRGYIEKYPPTEYNRALVERLDTYWVSPTSEFLSVSANPSMHVAWGLMLVWFSFELSPYLILLSIPWFVMQTTGTMYMFQHFATDVITGLIIGAISIFIVSKLIKLEKKYYLDDYKLLSIFDVIKKIVLGR